MRHAASLSTRRQEWTHKVLNFPTCRIGVVDGQPGPQNHAAGCLRLPNGSVPVTNLSGLAIEELSVQTLSMTQFKPRTMMDDTATLSPWAVVLDINLDGHEDLLVGVIKEGTDEKPSVRLFLNRGVKQEWQEGGEPFDELADGSTTSSTSVSGGAGGWQ